MKHPINFEKFFEAQEAWETDIILYLNTGLYPKDTHDFPVTEQRTLAGKVDPVTKRIAQFINIFNRKDSRSKIEAQWEEYKTEKPAVSHISGTEIRQYVYWDRVTNKLKFKPEKIERFLEYYFDIENKIALQQKSLG